MKGLEEIKANIKFFFCDKGGKKLNNVHITLKNYVSEKVGLHFVDNSVQCSIEACRIGLYLKHHKKITSENVKDLKHIDHSYYVVIVPDEEHKGLYYTGLDNEVDEMKGFFPLVPCPYHNWVGTAFLTQYKVRESIINNGQLIKDNEDSNILIPAFRISSEPYFQNHFVCGKLLQIDHDPVDIGFKIDLIDPSGLKEKIKNKAKHKITLHGNEIKCDGNKINTKTSFGFLDKEYILNSKESLMTYFNEKFEFYHGQLILEYDEVTNIQQQKYFLSLFKQDSEIVKHSPKCYGYIDDLKQTFEFTFRIDKKDILDVTIMKDDKNNEVPVVYLNDYYKEKGKISVECYVVKSGDKDKNFNGYYNKAYKTKLQRVVQQELKHNDQPEVNELIISSENDKLFGIYICQLECNGCNKNDYVKDRNILLLPSTLFNVSSDIKVYSDSKNYLSCRLNIDKFGQLKSMSIIYKGKSKIEYDAIRNTPEDVFKKNDTSVEYVGNKYEMADLTYVTCSYTAFGKPYILQTKVMHYNELRSQSDDVGNKILVPIIISVGVGVFIIIGIILLITFRIIKRRKKVKLLSMASSASDASSMSGSRFSKLSRSSMASQSRSKFSSSRSGSRAKSSMSLSNTDKRKNNRPKTRSKVSGFAG
uniref:ZP domain-containing protein n=1 Tax=Strongyloides papillosus TaxID=174720 RepID=A0A0N5C411_STREA